MKKIVTLISLLFTAQLFNMQAPASEKKQELADLFHSLPYELRQHIQFERLMDVNPLNLKDKQNLQRFMQAVNQYTKSERIQLISNAAKKYYLATKGKTLKFKPYLKQGDKIKNALWKRFTIQELWDADMIPKQLEYRYNPYTGTGMTWVLDLGHKFINNFEGIENYNLEQVELLELSENYIEELSPLVFQKMPNLQELYITKNLISILPTALFINNKKLKNIFLSSNKLKDIPLEVFTPLNLYHLDFAFNPLTTKTKEKLKALKKAPYNIKRLWY